MRVAGIGFRKGTPLASLREALDRAGGAEGVTLLATAATKADALAPFAASLGLPVIGVAPADLAAQPVITQSPRIRALHGTGSLAEAAALAAAGPGARLVGPRAQSSDGSATAALAERTLP